MALKQLTGPVNAILSSSGERERQYTAAVFIGLIAIVFGAWRIALAVEDGVEDASPD